MTCPSDGEQYSAVCGCISHNGFLTRAGYRSLDQAAQPQYLDKVGSVSGLRRDEITMIFDEGVLNEQFERFAYLESSRIW